MTGTQHAGIDFPWLIANLQIGRVPIGVDETQIGSVETFVLSPKAVHAAEAFVLGLFQLYPTVYFHKATRGAEKLFTELLVRVVTLVLEGSVENTGLPTNHPLVRFASNPENIDVALALDDTVVSGALSLMCDASDSLVSNFATRMRDRKLFKCTDIRTRVSHAIDPKGGNSNNAVEAIDKCCAEIKRKLEEWSTDNDADCPRVLVDADERSPYKPLDKSKGPLDRINIQTDGGVLVDLRERSSVVSALKVYKLFRVYADEHDAGAKRAIEGIVQGEIQACQ
jgi:HD superfamily phosphohydrolase